RATGFQGLLLPRRPCSRQVDRESITVVGSRDVIHASPVNPFVRGIAQLDFLLTDIPFVTSTYEVDPPGLVLDAWFAPLGIRDFLVAVREPADVDAKAIGFAIPGVPDGRAEYGIIDAFFGAWGNDPHDVYRPLNRDGAVLPSLDQWNHLWNYLIL